jgi:Pectinacetylesterase
MASRESAEPVDGGGAPSSPPSPQRGAPATAGGGDRTTTDDHARQDAAAGDSARADGSAATLDVARDGAAVTTPADESSRDASLTPTSPPFLADGEPLKAAQGTWTYTEFADSACRDGSPAGVSVNLGSVNKLLIFLEGGGRCTDEQTCALNPARVDDLLALAIRTVSSAGILDRSKAENPVRDWSFVHVPYCTGDRHGGANPDANVPGVGPQKLVGQSNLKKFLKRIVPTFPNVSDVLFTGISAGAFGVAYNGVLVQRAFPKLKVKLVIDSAPFVSKAVFAPCDQERTRALYAAEQTFLGDCGAACPNENDYWWDFGLFLAQTFRDRPSGLIASTEDAVERALFGIGNDGCTGTLDFFNPRIPPAALRSEILAYREQVKRFPNFGTFYPEGDLHTLIAFDEFYTASAGGVKLVDWFAKIVNGQPPGHAGP